MIGMPVVAQGIQDPSIGLAELQQQEAAILAAVVHHFLDAEGPVEGPPAVADRWSDARLSVRASGSALRVTVRANRTAEYFYSETSAQEMMRILAELGDLFSTPELGEVPIEIGVHSPLFRDQRLGAHFVVATEDARNDVVCHMAAEIGATETRCELTPGVSGVLQLSYPRQHPIDPRALELREEGPLVVVQVQTWARRDPIDTHAATRAFDLWVVRTDGEWRVQQVRGLRLTDPEPVPS